MKNSKAGFSLVELLMVVTIIILMSTIVLVSFRSGQDQFTLQRAAHLLAQDIRRAQELAMRAEDFHGTVSRGGFGVHLTTGASSYVLFADCDNGRDFDLTGSATSCVTATTASGGSFPEQLESRTFEAGVTITSITPAASSTIVFIPPRPVTQIRSGGSVVTSTTITLGISGLAQTQRVFINNAGLITIE